MALGGGEVSMGAGHMIYGGIVTGQGHVISVGMSHDNCGI